MYECNFISENRFELKANLEKPDPVLKKICKLLTTFE